MPRADDCNANVGYHDFASATRSSGGGAPDFLLRASGASLMNSDTFAGHTCAICVCAQAKCVNKSRRSLQQHKQAQRIPPAAAAVKLCAQLEASRPAAAVTLAASPAAIKCSEVAAIVSRPVCFQIQPFLEGASRVNGILSPRARQVH